ncbi:MAG: AMP-binding protein [Propionibacterium acidifaciens]
MALRQLTRKLGPDDGVVALSTAGSTGSPKLAAHGVGPLLRNASMRRYGAGSPGAGCRYSLSQSAHFSSAFVVGVACALSRGMSIFHDERPFDVHGWPDDVVRFGIGSTALTPHMLSRLAAVEPCPVGHCRW